MNNHEGEGAASVPTPAARSSEHRHDAESIANIPLGTLRCPATLQRLRSSPSGLETVDGVRAYRVVDGVPILVADDLSLFSATDIVRDASASGRLRQGQRPWRRLLRLLPSSTYSIGARDRYRRLASLL